MQQKAKYIENELLAQLAEGNQDAFSRIYHFYREKIYSLAFHLTGSIVISEEIVQDTFMKVWQNQQKLPAITDFDSWLFIVARNHIYTALKRIAKEPDFLLPEDLELPYASSIEESIDYKVFETIMGEALARLSPQQYEVYHLLKEQQLSREAVANQLGLSAETVKVHLARAMRSIRAYVTSKLPLTAAMFVIWRHL